MVSYAAFPTDRPDLSAEQMNEITCELLDPYVARKNFKVSEFLTIFLAQPWLVEQALNDVKLEEGLKTRVCATFEMNDQPQPVYTL